MSPRYRLFVRQGDQDHVVEQITAAFVDAYERRSLADCPLGKDRSRAPLVVPAPVSVDARKANASDLGEPERPRLLLGERLALIYMVFLIALLVVGQVWR